MIKKLQNWVLSWDFVRFHMYTTVYQAATKDVLASNMEDIEGKAQEKAKLLMAGLLSPVDMGSIVSLDKRNGLIYIGGEKADEARLQNLKSEADFLSTSELWNLINETPKELAQKAMFMEGDSIEQVRKGRSILYTLSVQRNIIDLLKSFSPTKR